MAAKGIICQSCGIEAPAKYVEFYQNIGALIMRFDKSIKGNLCKRCIHKHFWQMTLTNVTLGWWGTISLILTPVFTINNVARYVGAIGLASPPPDARPPELTNDVVARLGPHTDELMRRLSSNEDLVALAQEVAPRAGATPGQVVRYVIALIEHQEHQAALQAQAQAQGYPYGYPAAQPAQYTQQTPQQAHAVAPPALPTAEEEPGKDEAPATALGVQPPQR